ncbi:MAG: DNA gyrase subunit A [candidate division WS2 bacterium]|nr:DNA gyrase subunit A [Candidatus Lithacetigena glycinireducens]
MAKNLLNISLEQEVEASYLDYAMSVIVGRALPDVRDGLKPVQRRILHAMNELGNDPDKPYKKSARIVGEVLGKYHPHGDTAVYDSLTRMAQPFSYRQPLIDGHGNFGSIDGDTPAAMRYTEVRMSWAAMEMLKDLNFDTVEFIPNFDGTLKEPTVLPCRLPNLLINGASGIAVGMATSIPPHNLGEVIKACLALLDNDDLSIDELMNYIKGPDFPTGGIVLDKNRILESYKTGRGILTVQGKVTEEKHKDKTSLIVNEIPYMVNKSQLVAKIADLIKDKKLSGATEVRDESDKRGIRVVVELKKDANFQLLTRQLYKYTQLQTSFSINLLAIVHVAPRLLNIKDLLIYFLNHRNEVVTRRSQFELKKLSLKKHLLDGVLMALSNLDEVIEIIKSSSTPEEARNRLINRFALSREQAEAILDIKLERLTRLESDKLINEIKGIEERIDYLNQLLANPEMVKNEIRKELIELDKKFTTPRLSVIQNYHEEVQDIDLIPDEPLIIYLTENGYLKELLLTNRPSSSLGSAEEDLIEGRYILTTMKSPVFLFTNKGKGYKLFPYHLPEVVKGNRGLNLQGLLELDAEEKVVALATISSEKVLLMTLKGRLKAVKSSSLNSLSKRGTRVMNILPGDEFAYAREINSTDEVIVYSNEGKANRFPGIKVPVMGLKAQGVLGMRTEKILGMTVLKPDEYILTLTNKGYMKLVDREEIPSRGVRSKGLMLQKPSSRTGSLIGVYGILKSGLDFNLYTKSGKCVKSNTSMFKLLKRTHKGTKPGSDKIKISAVSYIVLKKWKCLLDTLNILPT